ncbi:uncharacterized protein LOC124170025 [Ischnura elegans]|uniref:uncharacterized protein LOC124170025 n=1 Tax=Ischnura elegans TaxID=197161 RepID=UPI001ED895E7|nr:uncharacterized protein LOC124170025 [Ischnura elegans]XP_046404676.1 uncharacterized protein LOC124170025 [Ischnura elegans]
MRWKRGSRAFLRLPCAWLLLLLPLAAAAGLGEEVATPGRHHGTLSEVPSAAPHTGDSRLSDSGEGVAVRGGAERSLSSKDASRRNGKRLDEDEESRILWRGWLLVDEAPTRRKAHITPKSVFIAPVIRGGSGGIPACAEGYRSDAMGRCHKVVRVNQEAHLNFLLQRLNALYREPSPPSSSSTASQGDAAEKGPLLVTIPLATNPPQNEESEEEGDDVDLVVVVETGIPKDAPGKVPGRLGLFGGEQVAEESQDDVVMQGGTGLPSGTLLEVAQDKLMPPASAIGVGVNDTSAIGSGDGGDSLEQYGDQLQASAGLSLEPVIHADASNTTEESNVRREIAASDTIKRAPNVNPKISFNETAAAFIATESGMNHTSADNKPDVLLANGHIYETTVIANYSTTELNAGKVTELPEVLHKESVETVPEGNISEQQDGVEEETQKRVVFPGRVEERVRFPETDEQRLLHPGTTVSSETPTTHPSQHQKPTSRPWGAWNRPMLLKFWTQMPLVREPSHGSDSVAKGVLPTTSVEDASSFAKQEESWPLPVQSESPSKVHQGEPYQRRPWIYYQEMSPRDLASVSRVFDRVRHFESRG